MRIRKDTKTMMVGGGMVGAGAIGLAVVPANAPLTTTAVIGYVGTTPMTTIGVATGWGLVAMLSKATMFVGASVFMYGFVGGIKQAWDERKKLEVVS